MKRLLMTLLTVFAIGGYVFSQGSHWPEINDGPFEGSSPVVAFIQIEGEFITADDPYDQIEVAAFVNGEYRGNVYMEDFTLEYGDPYPIVQLSVFFYENESEPVTFKMFDHTSGYEYSTYLINQDVITNVDYDQIWMEDYDNALIMNFMPALTKDIVGYGTDENPGGFYLIATPAADGTAPAADNGFVTAAFDLYFFNHDELGEEWQNYKETDFTLSNGQGYLYASAEDTQLVFEGKLYSGDGVVDLVYNEAVPELGGWNLVGNPYPAEAGVDREDYYILNGEGSDFIQGSGDVPAMAAIFVLADEEGESVTFTLADRAQASPSLALNISQGRGVVDRAVVRFGEGRKLPKFQKNPSHTKVYIPQEGDDYAVVRAGNMGEMPVNFKAEHNGSYTMSVNAEEVSFNYLHLIDNLTGNDVDLLSTPSYSFDARTTDYASRFKLVFATGDSSDDNFAFMSNGSIIVSNEGEATLQVIDVNGRILRSESINGTASIKLNAAAGVYMLRLINGSEVKVQKMIVK